MTLVRVHHEWTKRVWYIVTMPWTASSACRSGSARAPATASSSTKSSSSIHRRRRRRLLDLREVRPGMALLLFPFGYSFSAGWLVVPVVIFVVMFTANAVNIADGMDGLAGGMLIISFRALTLLLDQRFGEIAILNATAAGAWSLTHISTSSRRAS